MTEVKSIAFGPPSAQDLALEAEAEKLRNEGLAKIRAAAADWAKTIASLTGILGIVGLVKGREDVSDLVMPAQVLIGLFLATGLVFAIRSILLAALAAEGTPKTWWSVGQKLKEQYRNERELAAQQLRRSREGAVAAALFLILAVGVAWYSPEEEADPKPVKVLVTFTDRGPLCGDLSSGSKGLNVSTVSIADGNVRSLNVVSACPKE